MKKFLILPMLAFAFSAMPAYAATIMLSPTTVTVSKGQTVQVVVTVNPASASISAVKSEISYPTNLLTPTNFTFAPTWIPVTQSGYDQMSGGTVIKTAGYPGGLKTANTFGTLTLTANADGVATIAVTKDSVAYDANNNNALTGTQGSSVITIQAATGGGGGTATTPTNTSTSTPTSSSVSPKASTGTGSNGTVATPTVAPTTATAESTTSASSTDALAAAAAAAQTAAAAGSGTGFFSSSFWGWLILLIVVVLIAGGSWYYARKKDQ